MRFENKVENQLNNKLYSMNYSDLATQAELVDSSCVLFLWV